MAQMTTRKKIALWVLIAPTALIIFCAFAFAATNYVLSTSELSSSNTLAVGVNVTLYVLALIASFAWLPGIITGIVLLASKGNSHAKN